ncbi:hypothetical protein LguiA_026031 [Lonicera macranthoides]
MEMQKKDEDDDDERLLFHRVLYHIFLESSIFLLSNPIYDASIRVFYKDRRIERLDQIFRNFLRRSSIPPSESLTLLYRLWSSLRARTMTTTTSPPTFQMKEKINLTEKESQIFELLLQVVGCFSLQTQIRVVGGWVRDKLLGQPCNDIDIALDNMLGTEFTEKLNEYLSSLGKEKQKINQILRNPEKSKHLETAKTHIDGIEMDFVNLRSEDYSENSGIPMVVQLKILLEEINLMISGKHPDQAMTYIWDMQIFSVIFSVPHQLELPASEERLCVAYISDALRIMQIIEAEDYADYAFDVSCIALHNQVVIHIFRNSLKLKCIDAEVVVSLHNAAEKFMSLIPHIKSAEDIRIAEIGSKVELTDFSGDKLRMLADLEKIWEMKPLLNGNNIINVLDLKGGGPIVGELQKKLVEQQLLRRCRNRDECVEWLKQTHSKCSEKFDTVTKPIDRVRGGNQRMKSKRRKQKEGVGG